MRKTELFKRHILLFIGLFFIGLGIAVTKKSGLGVTPLTSIPNVISLKLVNISMGTLVIVWNIFLVLMQLVIKRKNFRIKDFFQIPVSILFGFFTDTCFGMLYWLKSDVYIINLALTFVGAISIGLGIALSVLAKVIMNPSEGFVETLSETVKMNFGYVKLGVDIGFVVIAVVLSIVMFGGQVLGVREGTLVTAVVTSVFVKLFTDKLKEKVETQLTK